MAPQTDDQARKDELIMQALWAFDREAGELSKQHAGEWAAYHGSRRVGIAKTRPEAWAECVRQGLPDGEFWVLQIQPVVDTEMVGGGLVIEQYDP